MLVLIVQGFLKVPSLHALAPNGNEPPFVVAQVAAMTFSFVLGVVAAFKFRPAPRRPPSAIDDQGPPENEAAVAGGFFQTVADS